MVALKDRLTTSASHYVVDLLEPGAPLWMIGLEIVKEGENLPNWDNNDLITILIDQLEDALLDKWSGGEPFNPSNYTALCVLLSDIEWGIILVNLIPEWEDFLDQQEQERIAQERLLSLFAESSREF